MEHDDVIEREEQEERERAEEELEEETVLRNQLGHVPGRLPTSWFRETRTPGSKEISLDHATDDEWEDFLNSLVEEEE
jgi:hypothetical protein